MDIMCCADTYERTKEKLMNMEPTYKTNKWEIVSGYITLNDLLDIVNNERKQYANGHIILNEIEKPTKKVEQIDTPTFNTLY